MKALLLVESEQELLERRVNHPDLFFDNQVSTKSNLYWHPTPTALSEILCSLDLDAAIHRSDGSKASFSEIVKAFEWFLNVHLGDARDVKRAIVRRKLKLTSYIDRIRSHLVEYSKEC